MKISMWKVKFRRTTSSAEYVLARNVGEAIRYAIRDVELNGPQSSPAKKLARLHAAVVEAAMAWHGGTMRPRVVTEEALTDACRALDEAETTTRDFREVVAIKCVGQALLGPCLLSEVEPPSEPHDSWMSDDLGNKSSP